MGVICRMYVCSRKINFQYIDFFVPEVAHHWNAIVICSVVYFNSIEWHCSLRGNFLLHVFYIWSLLLSLPSLNVRVEFFRFPGDKRRFVGDTSVVCLFRIPYYPPFCTVLHSSVLSLGVVCWLQICIRELIFNTLIFLLVSELNVAFSNARFFVFVSE